VKTDHNKQIQTKPKANYQIRRKEEKKLISFMKKEPPHISKPGFDTRSHRQVPDFIKYSF